jgi:hypothetical protein
MTSATAKWGAMNTQNGTTNGTAKEVTRGQSRAGVITYLTYALDDVSALSPTAVHLLEMAIAILADEPHPESEVAEPARKAS